MLKQTTVEPGTAERLGAEWDGAGTNFALFSAHASKVELCLLGVDGRREIARIPLPGRTGEIWHGTLPGVGPGQLYGYRVHGPDASEDGHRFDADALLLDPYAKALQRPAGSEFPVSAVADPSFDWGDDRPPRTPWSDTVIYEAHVRSMTMLHPEVPDSLKGTVLGLSSPPIIDHLKRLGVTAIELLPVHAYADEPHLANKGLTNHWGYNSIGFFAPEPRYLGAGGLADFQTMVRRFHAAGIEVLLDVVYNHTAEGDAFGPTLSFRGIDNASYYRLIPEDKRRYVNDTGCGNTLNMSHPQVVRMVIDSLRYWVEVMHVDGFRFDLATTLARTDDGFTPDHGFFTALADDPVLSRVKLIAEPWDVGPGGYRLGQFPPLFAEWNDKYRDLARRYWRGDGGTLPELAPRLLGSADLFDHSGRRPRASVNFIAAHDGFTLEDVVSYDRRHNEANGEGGADGHAENLSHNYGVEGPTDDPAIRVLRARQKRNLLATLLLSQGTPMLLAGDEVGNSQGGNNNAYCQDNEISWIDWAGADADDAAFGDFARAMTAFRKQHSVLRQGEFLHGDIVSEGGLKNVTWFTPDGLEKAEHHWRDPLARCIGIKLGASDSADRTLLIIMNSHDGTVDFTLPAMPERGDWTRLLDTGAAGHEFAPAGPFPPNHDYPAAGRTVLVFGC